MRKKLIALQEMLGVTAEQRPPDSSWGRGPTLLGDGCWAVAAICGCCCLPCSDPLEDGDLTDLCAKGSQRPCKKKKKPTVQCNHRELFLPRSLEGSLELKEPIYSTDLAVCGNS